MRSVTRAVAPSTTWPSTAKRSVALSVGSRPCSCSGRARRLAGREKPIEVAGGELCLEHEPARAPLLRAPVARRVVVVGRQQDGEPRVAAGGGPPRLAPPPPPAAGR